MESIFREITFDKLSEFLKNRHFFAYFYNGPDGFRNRPRPN